MHTQLSLASIGSLIDGTLENPADLLGPHPVHYRGETAVAVRSLLPEATAAWIVDHREGIRRPMRKVHPAGFFEGLMPLGDLQFDSAGRLCTRQTRSAAGKTVRDVSIYNIEASDSTGKTTAMHDPYASPSMLSDFDRYLLGEGRICNCTNASVPSPEKSMASPA